MGTDPSETPPILAIWGGRLASFSRVRIVAMPEVSSGDLAFPSHSLLLDLAIRDLKAKFGALSPPFIPGTSRPRTTHPLG